MLDISLMDAAWTWLSGQLVLANSAMDKPMGLPARWYYREVAPQNSTMPFVVFSLSDTEELHGLGPALYGGTVYLTARAQVLTADWRQPVAILKWLHKNYL